MADSLALLPALLAPEQLAPAEPPECAREPIHRLGSIQPHGVLLVLDQAAERVTWASANLGSLLPLEAGAAIGAPAAEVLPAWMLAALAALPPDAERPVRLSPGRGQANGTDEVFAHRGDDGLVIELIAPTAGGATGDARRILRQLQAELAEGEANPFRDAQALARAARKLTGHERAMVYRFRPDWSGEVLAEERAPHLMPFLGLRFPAGDIPAQARALYVRNRLRVTVDASDPQVPLLPAGAAAPNLGMAILRSVSPVHLAYLRNMGVRASLVASIMVDDRLWGMLACHHDQPSLPPAPVREGMERLAEAFAPAVRRHRDREARVAAQQVAAAEARLAVAATRPSRLLPLMIAGPDGLMQACDADGIAWSDGTLLVAAGAAPPPAYLRRLMQTLPQGQTQAATAPEAADAAAVLLESTALGRFDEGPGPGNAAGMLAARLRSGGMLALFREEHVHEVAWGGDPGKLVTGPDGQLGPRSSFALWRESVRGTSRPWQDRDRGVLMAAARILSDTTEAWPELPGVAWDEFTRIGLGAAGTALRLADLLPRTEAVAVTDGEGADAPTLFVSDALLSLLGSGPTRPARRPWAEVAAKLGIGHAFGPDGAVLTRDIEAWSAERGPIGLTVTRAPLLQLDAPPGSGPANGRTLSIIRLTDHTRASRAAEAMDAAEARSARLMRTHEAMLRNLTHELRTPVHAIIGLSELVAEADAAAVADTRLYGTEMGLAARHLLEVIDAMLDLARIEAGQLTAGTAPIDLAQVARTAAAIGAQLCAQRGVRFEQVIPEGAIHGRGEARMLRQAILNLLGNAAKFTPAGGWVSLAVAASREACSITVSDTGPGIAPDLQAKVFEPFFQGEGATRHHGGLGLGLFLAKSFVTLHGGRLTLSSQPGEGASFRIDLPLAARAAQG